MMRRPNIDAPRPPDETAGELLPLTASEIRLGESDAPAGVVQSVATVEGFRAHLNLDGDVEDVYLAELLAAASSQVQDYADLPARFGLHEASARWREIVPGDRLLVPGPSAWSILSTWWHICENGEFAATSAANFHSTTRAEGDPLRHSYVVIASSLTLPDPPDDLIYWEHRYQRGWDIIWPPQIRDDEPVAGTETTRRPAPDYVIAGIYRIAATYYAYRETSDMGARAVRAALQSLFGAHTPVTL